MALKIYVNTANTSKAHALCLSATALRVAVAAPTVILGDKQVVELYLVESAGAYITTGTPRIGIGSAALAPASGTFTISDGSESASALPATITAAQLQAALNALNTDTGPGSDTVTVTSNAAGIYTVTWDTDGAQDLLTSTANNLDPDAQVIISRVRTGDTDTREKQIIRLIRRPAIYVHQWTPITNGWRGVLNANTTRVLQHLAASENYPVVPAIFEIEHTDQLGRTNTYVRKITHIMAQTVDPNTLEGADLPNAIQDTNAVRTLSEITALQGGTPTDLDAVITTDLNVDTLYVLPNVTIGASVVSKQWILVTGTDAEDAANGIIRPADYAATTNEKVWKAV